MQPIGCHTNKIIIIIIIIIINNNLVIQPLLTLTQLLSEYVLKTVDFT